MKLDFRTDNGIGTRATLGLIVLETDETIESEFSQIMNLEDVALYHSRIPMASEIRPDTLAKMEQDLPTSVQLFPKSLEFDVIGYGCTSASTVIGSDAVKGAIQTVCPNVEVTDPLAAIIAAAQSLEATRLGFVTPYVPEVSLRMREKLEDAGFMIAGFGSFEEGDDRIVARIDETSIKGAAIRIAAAEACDAIVVSCTNLRCLELINVLEELTGVPIIASNQALAWHMLRLSGVADSLPLLGRLGDLPISGRLSKKQNL